MIERNKLELLIFITLIASVINEKFIVLLAFCVGFYLSSFKRF